MEINPRTADELDIRDPAMSNGLVSHNLLSGSIIANQNIVPSGTSFGLGVIIALNPSITDRYSFCDGGCIR